MFFMYFLKYTKICQFWSSSQTFLDLVEKEQTDLTSTGLMISGAVWVKT